MPTFYKDKPETKAVSMPHYILDSVVVNTLENEYTYQDVRVYRYVSDAIHGLKRKHPDYTSMVIVIMPRT